MPLPHDQRGQARRLRARSIRPQASSRYYHDYPEFAETVNRMTNHQRNLWARAKYPGLQHKEVEQLWAFVSPPRADNVKAPYTTKVREEGTSNG